MSKIETSRHRAPGHRGFAIIEALVALLLVGIGLLAVSKLQTYGLLGTGEARSRTEAAHLSQRKLEELRNIVLRASFTGAPLQNGTDTVAGNNASYAMTWTVSTPNASLEQRLVQLTTTWTDSSGRTQRLDLNTLIAWDDPGLQARFSSNPSQTLIQPTGEARRGSGQIPNWNPASPLGTANADGSRIYRDGGTTYLLSSTGQILLSLPPKNNSAQDFTTISGRVMFDQGVNSNSIPGSGFVRVRLSSEGECVFDNRSNQLQTTGNSAYKFFRYTCYVGPGWYGNVAVTVDDGVSGQAASPTVCVGDPSFNGGVSNSTVVSAHPYESGLRSYRGFRASANGVYLATGTAGGRRYGLTYASNGNPQTGPFDGRPRPRDYPSMYASVSNADNYFNQDFLVTRLSAQRSCASQMAGGEFTRNAGAYVCINPDVYGETDVCPAIWPGFESLVGNGGSINQSLGVTVGGTGSGTVTSSTGGIACGAICATSLPTGTTVTLTAAPASGSTFTGWTGCSVVSGLTCSVTLSTGTQVTATFDSAPSTLSVSTGGSGAGSVTSADGNIACNSGPSGTCSASYATTATVVLTATAANGGSFTGWSGACSGTGSCTVTMDQSRSVTASFAPPASGNTLSVSVTGNGSVISSPTGINCSSGTCTASYGSATTVTLTATPANGSTFSGWSGACSGTGSCSVTMDQARNVTATFATPATTNSLSVTMAGTGTGSVSSSPAGISCTTGTCSASYSSAATVTLTATANTGSTFAGWSGACSGTGTCSVTMSQARSVTATFTANAVCTTPVSGSAFDKNGSVSASPSNFGSCNMSGGNSSNYSCSFSAPSGTVITLTNSRTNGNPQYSYTKTITANCAAQSNVNFP